LPGAFFFLRKAAARVAHAVGVHVSGMSQLYIDPFGRQPGRVWHIDHRIPDWEIREGQVP
jgi:hypothetical protein